MIIMKKRFTVHCDKLLRAKLFKICLLISK